MTTAELNKAWESARRLLGLDPLKLGRKSRNNVETFFNELADIIGAQEEKQKLQEENDSLSTTNEDLRDDLQNLKEEIRKLEARK